ncbi:hypothetical protein GCM10023347_21380 [Streptomyces chumphonensis]
MRACGTAVCVPVVVFFAATVPAPVFRAAFFAAVVVGSALAAGLFATVFPADARVAAVFFPAVFFAGALFTSFAAGFPADFFAAFLAAFRAAVPAGSSSVSPASAVLAAGRPSAGVVSAADFFARPAIAATPSHSVILLANRAGTINRYEARGNRTRRPGAISAPGRAPPPGTREGVVPEGPGGETVRRRSRAARTLGGSEGVERDE